MSGKLSQKTRNRRAGVCAHLQAVLEERGAWRSSEIGDILAGIAVGLGVQSPTVWRVYYQLTNSRLIQKVGGYGKGTCYQWRGYDTIP